MYESPEAARYVKGNYGGDGIQGAFEGWLDIKGQMYKSEDSARYSSCTHKTCECGNIMEKHYVLCEACRNRNHIEKYLAKPFKEWDGKDYLYSDTLGRYFGDTDEIIEYLEDEGIEGASDLRLIICSPSYFIKVDADYWSNDISEDQESLPKELQEALEVLNKVIEELPPASYYPGKFRTTVEL